jgi:hypothetical protein
MLSCNESGEVRLSLMGGFAPSPSDRPTSRAVILGVVTEDKGGTEVTLSDCLRSSVTYSSSPLGSREQYFAHRAFLGAHLPSSADQSFQDVDLAFSGLSHWAASLTGFSSGREPYTFSYSHPVPLEGGFPGGAYVFGTSATSSNGVRSRLVTEDVFLGLKLASPMSEPTLQKDIIYPLQNFFTLATDSPNSLTKLEVSRHPLPIERIRVIGPLTFSDESLAEDLMPLQMLFSLEDVSDRLPACLKLWFELSLEHYQSLGIYFGSIYRPPGYTDVRFLQMMRAITLYQSKRNVGRKARVEETLAPELAPRVKDILDSHPIVLAERSLFSLIDEHEKEFSPLVHRGGGVGGFTTYALNTLQHLLTHRAPDGPHATRGSDQHWLNERLAFLFRIALLKAMQFPSNKVTQVLDRSPRYMHLRDVAPVFPG